MKPKISVSMIIKNEGNLLLECLESIESIADEIIIVDTGSTDNSVEIARLFTSNIYYFPWVNDFSAARNFSLTRATGEWILVIDADERLTKQSQEPLLEIVNTVPYHLPQVFNFLAISEKDRPMFTRALFPNMSGLIFKGLVHESLRYFNEIPKQWHCSNIHFEHVNSGSVSKEKAAYYLSLIEKDLKSKMSIDERVTLQKHLSNAYLILNAELLALNALEKCFELFHHSSFQINDIFYLNLMKDLITTGLKVSLDKRKYLRYARKLINERADITENWLILCYAFFVNDKIVACLNTIEDILFSDRFLTPKAHISLLIMKSRCLIFLSDFDEAFNCILSVYKRNPLPHISFLLGLIFLLKGEKKKAYQLLPVGYEKSLPSCKKWLQKFPNWTEKEKSMLSQIM